jgi:hypothetical protein
MSVFNPSKSELELEFPQKKSVKITSRKKHIKDVMNILLKSQNNINNSTPFKE